MKYKKNLWCLIWWNNTHDEFEMKMSRISASVVLKMEVIFAALMPAILSDV